MTHEIPFLKATGAGNDFVLIDNMHRWLRVDKGRLARALCDRHFGVGGDGLLVIEPSKRADFAMLYYNADGSFGGMCGNGGRCAAMFAYKAGYCGPEFSFRALAYTYVGSISGESVRLRMKNVASLRKSVTVDLGHHGKWMCYWLDTGSPHVVTVQKEIASIPVQTVGRMLREHSAFAPIGANVNFVRIAARRGLIAMRTYERGVEAETLACGTGAIASALVTHWTERVEPPIRVRTHSGKVLTVGFSVSGRNYINVTLEGLATIIFSGKCLYCTDQTVIYNIVEPEVTQGTQKE